MFGLEFMELKCRKPLFIDCIREMYLNLLETTIDPLIVDGLGNQIDLERNRVLNEARSALLPTERCSSATLQSCKTMVG